MFVCNHIFCSSMRHIYPKSECLIITICICGITWPSQCNIAKCTTSFLSKYLTLFARWALGSGLTCCPPMWYKKSIGNFWNMFFKVFFWICHSTCVHAKCDYKMMERQPVIDYVFVNIWLFVLSTMDWALSTGFTALTLWRFKQERFLSSLRGIEIYCLWILR